MAGENLVFVYGTLKQGFSNNHYLSGCKFIGTGRTKYQYAMYSNGIPFVVMTEPISEIHGELYEVNDSTLEILDNLEGHPDWYRREKVAICLDDDSQRDIQAWIFFNENNNGTLVPSGVFSLNRF